MPRPKLKPPERFFCEGTYRVRVTDVNYGGHLANDAVAGLLHQARIDVLHNLGVSELDIGDGRTGMIQTDMTILFHAEAFMHDTLTIYSVFRDVGRSRFRMFHQISRTDTQIVSAELGFAAFDYQSGKPTRLPASFQDAVAKTADEANI